MLPPKVKSPLCYPPNRQDSVERAQRAAALFRNEETSAGDNQWPIRASGLENRETGFEPARGRLQLADVCAELVSKAFALGQ